jgi:microcompartment protein CcmK/EutM
MVSNCELYGRAVTADTDKRGEIIVFMGPIQAGFGVWVLWARGGPNRQDCG